MPTLAKILILLIAGSLFGYSFRETEVPGGWLYQYQTLVAGLLALAGAAAAYSAIQSQIAVEKKREREHRRRQDLAMRPVLGSALSELSFYAEMCIEVLLKLVNEGGESVNAPVFGIPAVPKDITKTVSDCIFWAEEPAGKYMTDLLKALQVQSSRLRRLRGLSIGPHSEIMQNIVEHVGDAVDIYARAAALFAYARRKELNYRDDYFEHTGLLWHGYIKGDDEMIDKEIASLVRKFELSLPARQG
jgi:hypothetical protein